MLLARISFFLFRISLANSRSFYNELRNLALASYSYFSDSCSASRLVLKSAKSFADLISYSSRPLMVSLSLSISDWMTETIPWTIYSPDSDFSYLIYASDLSSSPNLTKSLMAYSSKRLAYLLSFSAYSPTFCFSTKAPSLFLTSLWTQSRTESAFLYSRSVSMKSELASQRYSARVSSLLTLDLNRFSFQFR